MDHHANVRMLLWPMIADNDFDSIPDFDENFERRLDSKDDEQTESDLQLKTSSHKDPQIPEEKIHWQEQIRMIHLRSHLNKLLETLRHAQYNADKTREELKKCSSEIEQFEAERDMLCKEIQAKETEGNKSAVPRLQAAYQRVCKELEAEQKVESIIQDRLEQAEYELALAEVERGKYILAEDDLLQRENQLNNEKAAMVLIRQQKEELLARNAIISHKKDKRKIQDALNDAEKRHIQAIEEAEKSHERANKYLSKTLTKLKKRQQEEQDRYNADMMRKMDMLLKLKNDIASNRDNLRAIWARDKAVERQRKCAKQEEMNQIHSEGGNAEEIFLIKKRRNEIEKKKQEFEADQKLKRVSIMQKILREEDNVKRKIQQQSYLWIDPGKEKALRMGPAKRKPPKALLDYMKDDAGGVAEMEIVDDERQKEVEGVDVVSSDSYFTSEEYRKTLRRLSYELDVGFQSEKERFQIDEIKEIDTVTVTQELTRPNKNKNQLDNAEEDTIDGMLNEKIEMNLEDEASFLDEGSLIQMAEEGEDDEEAEDEYADIAEEPPLHKVWDVGEPDEDEELQEDVAEPEFEGLWSKDIKEYKTSKDTAKPIGRSKMEQEILKRTLEKTREGIIITQVAGGKEFSGQPFYSKPSVIHFKDFVVGKSYKKKIMLTNVSYSVTYIRFKDVSDNLKDFINISFEPPGQMSAGMTCEMTVTFKPVINIDLMGEVYFLTQTGPFQIPLMCSTKKCDLVLDTSTVNFGTSVIGETLKQSFILKNRGALGTSFNFFKSYGTKPELEGTKLSLGKQFPDVLEQSQSKETALEVVRSLIPSRQTEDNVVAVEQDFNADEINHASEMAFKLSPEFKSQILSEFPLEDQEMKITTSSILVDPVLEQPATETEQSGAKKLSYEDLEKTSLMTVTGQIAAEEDMIVTESSEEATERSHQELVIGRSEEAHSVHPSLLKNEEEDISSLDGMRVGPLYVGEIGPFSSVCLEIIWQPTIPGEVNSKFGVLFSDSKIKPLSINAVANAIDVPVWVERQTVDLKICMFDRLYQDTVVVNNRATTAQKLQFEVCKELRNHMELLPKTGFIQSHSQFSAQLKFLPRQSLFKDATKFFDPETGVLEAPMTLRVAGQVTPVSFTVQAVVTTSDLEFGICNIDFGCCTIHESVKQTIRLTNKSILPQQYGFVGLPDYLEVQPKDGFGTLLPLETLELDVIFSPKAAKDYKMNLLCRTLINRDFFIPCQGVGVLTPLELSNQVIHFHATSLYDKSSAALYVVNNHTSTNEYTHPVPRIGKGTRFWSQEDIMWNAMTQLYSIPKGAFLKCFQQWRDRWEKCVWSQGEYFEGDYGFKPPGEICPVGPTSFEFKVPEDAPITISPSVGTILPGQKLRVEIRFSPTLSENEIRLEALKINTRLEEDKDEKEREEAARKLKEEEVNLHRESVVEPKPKKGAKYADMNANSKITDETPQAMKVDYKFSGSEKEAEILNLNKSANKNKQNSNIVETSKSVSHNFPVKKNKTFKNINGKSRKIAHSIKPGKSVDCINSHEAPVEQKESASSLQMVTRPVDYAERTGNSLRRNLDRVAIPIQEDDDNGKLLRDVEEGISRIAAMQKNASLRYHQVRKHQNSNYMGARKNMERQTDRMNSCSVDENKSNNKDENKDEDNENQQDSLVNRSNVIPEYSTLASHPTNFDIGNTESVILQDTENEFVESLTTNKKRKSRESSKSSIIKSKSKGSTSSMTPYPESGMAEFDPDKMSMDSNEHRAALASLIQQYKGHFQSVNIPCYVAFGRADNPGKLNYSIQNTLYLEVHCPAVRPPVVVISDCGRRTLDFGSVSIGQTCSRSVTILNISENELDLKATVLNTAGPFQLRNALRALLPGATHTILLTFTPDQANIFQENLGIKTLNSTLHLTLKGWGVSPLVKLSIEDGMFDMKAVLVGEFVEKLFTIENLSLLSIDYTIKQDSLSPMRHNKAQIIPPFLASQTSHNTKNYVGPQNKSGRSVFDIVPAMGTINAGETRELTVTFAPDHESDLFSDRVGIELCGQEESHFFQLIGQAKSQTMFLEGSDSLNPPMKSLAYIPKQMQDEESSEIRSKATASTSLASPPALITLQSVMKGDYFQPVVREIYVGCVRTMAAGQKKSGDFTVDGLQSLLQKGFTVQPQKGTVEVDTKVAVVFTWMPPTGYDPTSVLEDAVTVTLKGEVTEVMPIVIKAMVVSE